MIGCPKDPAAIQILSRQFLFWTPLRWNHLKFKAMSQNVFLKSLVWEQIAVVSKTPNRQRLTMNIFLMDIWCAVGSFGGDVIGGLAHLLVVERSRYRHRDVSTDGGNFCKPSPCIRYPRIIYRRTYIQISEYIHRSNTVGCRFAPPSCWWILFCIFVLHDLLHENWPK